jgi:hypothetical protein
MRLVGLLLILVSICSRAETIKTGGDHPTVTVTVVGHGPTEDDARRNGFRSAVELAAGNIIVSDTESIGAQLIQDRIGGYSSGYIDDYKILDIAHDSAGYAIKMSVTVGSSKIAGRMMSRNEHIDFIDGDRIQAQMESEFDQRNRGDQLITQILNSYPYNTFILNSGQTEFKLINRRQPFVEIPFAVEMNPAWLNALIEALDLVSMKSKTCGTWTRMFVNGLDNNKIKERMECGRTPDLRVNNNNYYFYDQTTLRLINSELQPKTGYQRIALHLDIMDTSGQVLDHRCTDVNTETFIKYNHPAEVVNLNDRDMLLRPEIVNQQKIVGVLNINIRNFSDVGKFKLTVGKTCQ